MTTALSEPSPALAGVSLTLPSAPARFLCLEKPSDGAGDGIGPPEDGAADLAPVLDARVLTSPEALKRVWSVTLDTSSIGEIAPGDTIGIICPNLAGDVETAIGVLGLADSADDACCVAVLPGTTKKAARVPAHLTSRVTSLRYILTHKLDLRAVPKKPLLLSLIPHTRDAGERQRLSELASRQGGEQYLQLVRGAGVTVLQLLTAFGSCRPPAELLLEQLPALRPRPYSAASCPMSCPGQLRVIFAVVPPPGGPCTAWLDSALTAALESGATLSIPVCRRPPGQFHLPEHPQTPVIMVAAGTGLAPFAGFLQRRRVLRCRAPAWLVYGCRRPTWDYLLRSELETAVAQGALSRLDVVYSRAGGPVRYVQEVLEQERRRLGRWLLQEGAVVYVCGDAVTMMPAVREQVVAAVAEAADVNGEEAARRVTQLQKEGRYRQDVWS